MNRLKALEILKNINVYGYATEVEKQIDEAIKELEELENRSCSNCSKYSYLDCPCWSYSDGKIIEIEYCSEWKNKE